MWLDQKKTLLENRNKDTWQMPVLSSDGDYLGNVVAQIVEPEECMVRYFLVYQPDQQRQFLLPSDTVVAIDDKVYSHVQAKQIAQIPQYGQSIERDDEWIIYDIITKTPYWEDPLKT